MEREIARGLLEALSEEAFRAFQLKFMPGLKPIPGDDNLFYEELIDSYGGSLHSAFLLHHIPPWVVRRLDPGTGLSPDLLARAKLLRRHYSKKMGAWGTVAPSLAPARQMQSVAILTNLRDLAGEQRAWFHSYNVLAKAHLALDGVFVGSIDSYLEKDPEGVAVALRCVLLEQPEGVALSIQNSTIQVTPFLAGARTASRLNADSAQVWEPVIHYSGSGLQTIIEEFEALLSADPSETTLESFLAKYYREIFGFHYDRVETQLWLRCPELDVGGRERRVDLFLRDAVTNDWELAELKKCIPLTRTVRAIPQLTSAIQTGINQLRSYGDLLKQDRVRKILARRGIDYFQPELRLVVGRTPTLPRRQWRWLKSNIEQQVELTTYDDLLTEMRARSDGFKQLLTVAK